MSFIQCPPGKGVNLVQFCLCRERKTVPQVFRHHSDYKNEVCGRLKNEWAESNRKLKGLPAAMKETEEKEGDREAKTLSLHRS